ncbi:patatin-like phospholipase family protein [Roseateles oligotrophus]|uniref:Patatin-like phospholipase family protein n=1 Tax=Roseateles oligotrophus TaxID=1769250 RepID=A0ABT2Y9G9_9BURK|nr:patatin-like phospholipase family protein [Roseateles oligotrophus]MCV2366939.1 patatin-like phospholipase family protein [Roseateles oligotrophus]
MPASFTLDYSSSRPSNRAGRRICCLLILAGLLLSALPGYAQEETSTPVVEALKRPKIGLVLSGGGVRGMAHIGVLRVLQELHVPVDLVVGTSMGAVVGGAFASGRNIDELEDFVRSTDWPAILADRPARQALSFRRREEDLILPSRIELGLHRSTGVSLPPSAAGNSALEFALERLIRPEQAEAPVSQLSLPFRALATDLLSGDMLEMIDTPLFLAMRASMAVPGVFTPVRINGRAVVDGGLVRNLGVDIARKMGADIIIAVNVGSPLLEEHEINSAVGVANQMLQILTNQNVANSLKDLRPDDVLIDPDLGNIAFMDFGRHQEAIASGQRAAFATHERLRALALPAEDYAALELNRLNGGDLAGNVSRLPLSSLEIRGTQRSNPVALKAEIDLPLGAPVSLGDIQKASAQLYGRGDFERIDTQISDEKGQRQVTLNVSEADWANSRLRIGLQLYSDFDDANRFSISVMHVWTWLNRWGAELRSNASIGDKRWLGTELFQPLGAGSPWFLTAATHYQGGSSDQFSNQGLRTSRYSANFAAASMALGRQISNWGDVRIGAGRSRINTRVTIPENPAQAPQQGSFNTRFFQMRADTLDSVAFPTRGFLFELGLTEAKNRDNNSVGEVDLRSLAAFRMGRWAGHVYGEVTGSSLGTTGDLGGFLRISGSPAGSLSGRAVAMSRLVMARQIAQMPVGLGGAIRAGFSLESGAILRASESSLFAFALPESKLAASGFLSMDTRFGPFYLAAGSTYQGRSSLYLFLGPIW